MHQPLNVFLTFDVEVWCNGWGNLDVDFPANYTRYVYGRSAAGDYALPRTIEILNDNQLRGVFFVEPLFAARFGMDYLRSIVQIIKNGGHEVQLHLHAEWVDEIHPPLINNCSTKRPYLSQYSADEQTELIGCGLRMLHALGCERVNAFRAGSFAVNADTYTALSRIGLEHDSSLNVCYSRSGPDMRNEQGFYEFANQHGVMTHPMTVMRDGFGRLRHAQVGACSVEEICEGLVNAHEREHREFVILSHNFEMLRQGTSDPDWIVVRRFEQLCRFLGSHTDRFQTVGYSCSSAIGYEQDYATFPSTSFMATAKRYLEQARRRI